MIFKNKEKNKFLLLLGTSRQGNQSQKVFSFLKEELEKRGIEVDPVQVKDFLIKSTEEENSNTKVWKEKLLKNNVLIIVSPEYNHGYPGELKFLLDSAFDEYKRKPVAFVGVSAGPFGGVRMIEQLKLVTIEFDMIPVNTTLNFGMVNSLFDEKGDIKDLELWNKRVDGFVEEIDEWLQVLR